MPVNVLPFLLHKYSQSTSKEAGYLHYYDTNPSTSHLLYPAQHQLVHESLQSFRYGCSPDPLAIWNWNPGTGNEERN